MEDLEISLSKINKTIITEEKPKNENEDQQEEKEEFSFYREFQVPLFQLMLTKS
jgi:hypothetical protein